MRQRFRNGNDIFRFQPLRLGCWRRETERFRRRGTRGSQEVAERPSQAPNGKRQVTASFSSRNEHARSRASSTGVGVRGDAARSACWFRAHFYPNVFGVTVSTVFVLVTVTVRLIFGLVMGWMTLLLSRQWKLTPV